MGISSEVRLAAMNSGYPRDFQRIAFGILRQRAQHLATHGDKSSSLGLAHVGCLAETSTIEARPASS